MLKNNTLILYIHGKGGTAEEAEHYKPLFPHCDVAGLDYNAEAPWDAKAEFPTAFEALAAEYSRVILIANSIGAYFSMCALPREKIEKAYFISPIVDMEKLIKNMMIWSDVSENELSEKGTVETSFGETLSWEYLCYVRSHPTYWTVPTDILYGGQDNLTDRETVTAFAVRHNASLTVMENGEHWFHTLEQMKFLDAWVTAIRTERLILRHWQETDAESLYEYAKDPDVGPIAGWQPHKSVDESLYIIQNVLNGSECYAICEKENDVAIGCIELRLNGHTDMTDRDDECELGYWLGKPFWGRGYMPEAAKAILHRAFDELKMSTVWCGYYDGNNKSKRVQEKLGFIYHHTCDNVSVPLMNEVRVGHTNVMTKEDWLKSNEFTYINLRQRPRLKDRAAEWFHQKWGVPEEAYLECMDDYLSGKTEYGWYLCVDGDKIVGGLGVIENDFHNRKDLTPNVCAVYTEQEYRSRGVAGRLLNMAVEDLRYKGISPVYLLTNHTGFYERYGWEFLCMVQGDGEEELSGMYVHR